MWGSTMSKINTSVCLKVHSFTHWLELRFDLEAMGYAVDTEFCEIVIANRPRFKGLYLHIEPDFTVCLHTHTLGSEVQPNFEYIVNELPQRPKGKVV